MLKILTAHVTAHVPLMRRIHPLQTHMHQEAMNILASSQNHRPNSRFISSKFLSISSTVILLHSSADNFLNSLSKSLKILLISSVLTSYPPSAASHAQMPYSAVKMGRDIHCMHFFSLYYNELIRFVNNFS